jgi:transposase-like protein
MSDEDQKLRVRLVGRDGRRRYDSGSKERLAAACLQPGVLISGLALAHGVNANLLRKWVKDAKEFGSLVTEDALRSLLSRLSGAEEDGGEGAGGGDPGGMDQRGMGGWILFQNA